jgi:hypothetical protein
MALASRRRLVGITLALALALQSLSCGTLLYPERRGQPSGRLDPGVVALDAVGLILFFVPGIVAFAVDFATGTIYLPPERPYLVPAGDGRTFQVIRANPGELTPERVETIVSRQTGQTIRLTPGSFLATKIERIEDFTPATVQSLAPGSSATGVIFRASSE